MIRRQTQSCLASQAASHPTHRPDMCAATFQPAGDSQEEQRRSADWELPPLVVLRPRPGTAGRADGASGRLAHVRSDGSPQKVVTPSQPEPSAEVLTVCPFGAPPLTLIASCSCLASRPSAVMQGQDLPLADRALSSSAAQLASALRSSTGAVHAFTPTTHHLLSTCCGPTRPEMHWCYSTSKLRPCRVITAHSR